jgi:hypothetical protein
VNKLVSLHETHEFLIMLTQTYCLMSASCCLYLFSENFNLLNENFNPRSIIGASLANLPNLQSSSNSEFSGRAPDTAWHRIEILSPHGADEAGYHQATG